MQLEAQTADKEDKAEFQAKLRDHRATLARHKSDIVCPQPVSYTHLTLPTIYSV